MDVCQNGLAWPLLSAPLLAATLVGERNDIDCRLEERSCLAHCVTVITEPSVALYNAADGQLTITHCYTLLRAISFQAWFCCCCASSVQ